MTGIERPGEMIHGDRAVKANEPDYIPMPTPDASPRLHFMGVAKPTDLLGGGNWVLLI
jgi:hypothetical protein